jgi:hypothetical protein
VTLTDSNYLGCRRLHFMNVAAFGRHDVSDKLCAPGCNCANGEAFVVNFVPLGSSVPFFEGVATSQAGGFGFEICHYSNRQVRHESNVRSGLSLDWDRENLRGDLLSGFPADQQPRIPTFLPDAMRKIAAYKWLGGPRFEQHVQTRCSEDGLKELPTTPGALFPSASRQDD